MPSYILQQAEVHVEQLLRYKRWIVDTVRYMYPERSLPKLNDDIDDMITLEIKLAKLSANNSGGKQIMTLRDLNARTSMDWLAVLRVLLNDSGVQVGLDDSVAVSYTYLLRLIKLVQKTSSNIFGKVLCHNICTFFFT